MAGAGMSALAVLALEQGLEVSGSDSQNSPITAKLESLGARAWSPHNPEILDQSLPLRAVISTAIPESNKELQLLRNKQVPVVHRSELLEEFAKKKSKQVVVSGTHGKTTTTSLISWALTQLNEPLSWLIGGQINDFSPSHWNPVGDLFVFEGDESDQSFLRTTPYISIITSLDPDHLENYNNSFHSQISKFTEFANKSRYLVYNSDDANINTIIQDLSPSVTPIPYSISDLPNINISNLPGKHNKLNAFACIKVLEILGYEENRIIDSLRSFPGIHRRFEQISQPNSDILVFDDYAHHPTEIAASIQTAQNLIPSSGKVIVIFQPHLPTRLRDLWTEFTQCFSQADILILMDLYLARGSHIKDITSENLSREINHKNVTYFSGKAYNNIIEFIVREARSGDLVLILGAGDITNIRYPLVEAIDESVNSRICIRSVE